MANYLTFDFKWYSFVLYLLFVPYARETGAFLPEMMAALNGKSDSPAMPDCCKYVHPIEMFSKRNKITEK